MAWIIGSVCYATVDLATLDTLPVNYLALLIGSAAVLLVGHVVIRRLAPYADPVLYPVAAMINLLGLVMIHRLDIAEQLRAEANDNKAPSADAVAQATWVLVALALFTLVLFLVTDHRKLQRYTFTSLVVGVVLLLLPLVPILGTSINGARLWIRLGPLVLPALRTGQDRAHDLLRRVPRPQAGGPGHGPPQGAGAGYPARA